MGDIWGRVSGDLLTQQAVSAALAVAAFGTFLGGFLSEKLSPRFPSVAAWLPGSEGGGVADMLVAGKGGKPRVVVWEMPLRDVPGIGQSSLEWSQAHGWH